MSPTLIVAALIGGAAASPQADFDARMRESVAAARALQGPWDGRWVLSRDGRPILVLQIIDPADGGAPQAAWRDLTTTPDNAPRPVAIITRLAHGLRLSLATERDARASVVILQAKARRHWSGSLRAHGVWSSVDVARE